MATIRDVAEIAKVSVATVSRVINTPDLVQLETKKRVQKAIEQLNYSPNMLGRDLRRSKTKKILVILNTISNQFYSQVVRGIESVAIPKGYSVMVCMTHGDKKIEKTYIDMIKSKLVDGAVFLTSDNQGEFLQKNLFGYNIVQACEPKLNFVTPIVEIDNLAASYEATKYLIGKGHKKIAFLGAGDIYQSSVLRYKGYKKALTEHHLRYKKVLDEGFSFNAGIRSAEKILNGTKTDIPTACFCVSDSCAAGVIKTFLNNGLKVPEDISVMGFDNTQLSKIYSPSITTLSQPQYEIGEKAITLLFDMIDGFESLNERFFLQYEIIERDSVL